MQKKIDLVYTWVNGDEPDYIDLYNQYATEPQDVNPERYRDTYQLLKYSLRSVGKFAPWINQIYLVTARPQVPSWLDTENPRVRIIHHDLLEEKVNLPTFNYNVIESFIHKIPGLSEDFIYLNDDFLFGQKVNKEDFYTGAGKVIIHGTLFGENFGWRIFNGKNDVFGIGLVEHSPLLIRKEWWQEMQKKKEAEIDKIKTHKFRRREDVMMYKLYRWFCLKYKSNDCEPIFVTDLIKIHTFQKIKNNLKSQLKAIGKLRRKQPKFYCLNDDQRNNPNIEVVQLWKDFLQEQYPEKSAFEK